MTDVQECRLAKIKTTVRLKTLDQLMAEGCFAGNSHSTLGSHRMSFKVVMTGTSTSTGGEIVTRLAPAHRPPLPGGVMLRKSRSTKLLRKERPS